MPPIWIEKIIANKDAMAAIMNIEGFRALGSSIFETVVNKSEKVRDTKKDKGGNLSDKKKRELSDEEKERAKSNDRNALLVVGLVFFLAELGDKTMLATVTLAATHEPIGTWLGSTAGMVLADALAVGAGSLLAERIEARTIARVAAASFVIFGVLLVVEGARGILGL